MKRTNIYLEESQAEALDEISRAQGVTRAGLVRRLVDAAIGEDRSPDLEADLAAIEESFGALAAEVDMLVRGPDERSAHLDRVDQR
jgi:Ribbon-helix-helix protein, copG family